MFNKIFKWFRNIEKGFMPGSSFEEPLNAISFFKNDQFIAMIDVQDAKEKDISIKTNNNHILIEINKVDEYSFKLKEEYFLPPEYDLSTMTSKLENNILTLIVKSICKIK